MGNVVEADIVVHCALFDTCIYIEHLLFESRSQLLTGGLNRDNESVSKIL